MLNDTFADRNLYLEGELILQNPDPRQGLVIAGVRYCPQTLVTDSGAFQALVACGEYDPDLIPNRPVPPQEQLDLQAQG